MDEDLSHLPQNKRDDLQRVVEIVREHTVLYLVDRVEALLNLTEERCREISLHFSTQLTSDMYR